MSEPLIQYIILRKDLLSVLKWPLGALIAQACHASTAVNSLFSKDENVVEYLKDLDRMHKVVLEISDEQKLIEIKEKLNENGVDFNLWIEQPENIPTCIAVKPYRKSQVKHYFKKLTLFNL